MTVTGRSVLSRSVKHGIPSTVVSSWIPPESVTTAGGARLQRQEPRVRERRDELDTLCDGASRPPGALACPRMNREHDRDLARDLLEPAQRLGDELSCRRPARAGAA